MKDKHLLIVAVLLGIVAVILVNREIGAYEKKANRPTTQLYRAAVDIEGGSYTVQDAVGRNYLVPVRRVPKRFAAGYPEAVQESTMRAVLPMRIHRGIRAGEFLHHHHLEEVSRADLQRRIPPGRKLLTMPVTKQGTISFFIQPGDVVDFYQVRSVTDPAVPGGSRQDVVKIASAIRILAADKEWVLDEEDADGERGRSYSIITIAVDEPLWKKLLLEQQKGPITFQLTEEPAEDR